MIVSTRTVVEVMHNDLLAKKEVDGSLHIIKRGEPGSGSFRLNSRAHIIDLQEVLTTFLTEYDRSLKQ